MVLQSDLVSPPTNQVDNALNVTIQPRFDRIHGKGAFARLRAMLNDPGFSYQHTAKTFGLTRQRIAQLANELSINGSRRYRQRESMRMLHREPRVIKVKYPPAIRSVINKIKRSGFAVTPYVLPVQPSAPYRAWRSLKMVVVNGRLCTIQFRKGRKLRPNGREYVWFDTTVRVKRAEFALWTMRSNRAIKVYVIPLTHLRNISSVSNNACAFLFNVQKCLPIHT